MSTTMLFKKVNPHASVFFNSLNIQFFLILLIISFIVAVAAQMPIFILIIIVIGFALKYFLDKDDLQQYQLKGADKRYYLISEGILQKHNAEHNYLEDFITDFLNCDWEDKNMVSQFKTILRLVNPEKFPKAKIEGSSQGLKEELTRSFKRAIYVISDDLKLQGYLLEIDSLLKKNNTLRNTSIATDSKQGNANSVIIQKAKVFDEGKLQEKSSILNFRMANETGIAGFFLSFILPLQSFQLDITLSTFPEFSNGKFALIFIFILALLALTFSIDGIAKDGKKYQKGLAVWGFVFNLLFVLSLIKDFFSNNNF